MSVLLYSHNYEYLHIFINICTYFILCILKFHIYVLYMYIYYFMYLKFYIYVLFYMQLSIYVWCLVHININVRIITHMTTDSYIYVFMITCSYLYMYGNNTGTLICYYLLYIIKYHIYHIFVKEGNETFFL